MFLETFKRFAADLAHTVAASLALAFFVSVLLRDPVQSEIERQILRSASIEERILELERALIRNADPEAKL